MTDENRSLVIPIGIHEAIRQCCLIIFLILTKDEVGGDNIKSRGKIMKNFFTKNNKIYKGDKTSATPIKEIWSCPNSEVKTIERQESVIKKLEKESRTNSSIRFYMYGY